MSRIRELYEYICPQLRATDGIRKHLPFQLFPSRFSFRTAKVCFFILFVSYYVRFYLILSLFSSHVTLHQPTQCAPSDNVPNIILKTKSVSSAHEVLFIGHRTAVHVKGQFTTMVSAMHHTQYFSSPRIATHRQNNHITVPCPIFTSSAPLPKKYGKTLSEALSPSHYIARAYINKVYEKKYEVFCKKREQCFAEMPNRPTFAMQNGNKHCQARQGNPRKRLDV